MGSGARANWFTDLELEPDSEDPFDGLPPEEVGEPVAVAPGERYLALKARLDRLMDGANGLLRGGHWCDLREKANSSCMGCPFSQHANRDTELGVVCRNGREMERVVTEIEGLKMGMGHDG